MTFEVWDCFPFTRMSVDWKVAKKPWGQGFLSCCSRVWLMEKKWSVDKEQRWVGLFDYMIEQHAPNPPLSLLHMRIEFELEARAETGRDVGWCLALCFKPIPARSFVSCLAGWLAGAHVIWMLWANQKSIKSDTAGRASMKITAIILYHESQKRASWLGRKVKEKKKKRELRKDLVFTFWRMALRPLPVQFDHPDSLFL